MNCPGIDMAQLIVRNIEEIVKRRLRERAARNGRSMEEETRLVLRAAVAFEAAQPERLGSAIAARFAGVGLETPILELHGESARPADFSQ